MRKEPKTYWIVFFVVTAILPFLYLASILPLEWLVELVAKVFRFMLGFLDVSEQAHPVSNDSPKRPVAFRRC